MFGVYKTYEEFVAAAEEAAKRGELWFCPSCFSTNPVMKFCGAYELKAHYVHCPACCMQANLDGVILGSAHSPRRVFYADDKRIPRIKELLEP